MANWYFKYPGAGAADGTSWANAYSSLESMSGKTAGDDFWVAHDHAEPKGAAMVLTCPGTLAAPCRIICVNTAAGAAPFADADLRTTATISTTGAFGMTRNGHAYVYGITFNSGSSGAPGLTTGSTASNWIMESCAENLFGAGLASLGQGTAVTTRVKLKSHTIKFGAVGGTASLGCAFEWDGGSVDAAGSAPTTLLTASSARTANAVIENVDLSHLGSGKTLVGAAVMDGNITFKNCKLGASVTLAATPTGAARIEFINCNSADTNYTNALIDRYGTMSEEITIVRTGGATDGTTPIAHKIVTTANAKFNTPFRSKSIFFWNESTSAITITLEGIWGGGSVPNNDDIWMEVAYSGDASYPLGSVDVADRKASTLATAAGQAAGSGTWGGSTTKFALSTTITPANKGWIELVVKAGAASSTFYIDPKPVVT